MKSKGARFGFVENTASGGDQVQPVGPACISGFDTIIETVDEGRKLDSEFSHASPGHIESFGLVGGAGEDHVITHVGLHLPYVGRVRLENIDRVERNLVLVLLSKLVQGGNLPPKWRSRIAPEDQDDRL